MNLPDFYCDLLTDLRGERTFSLNLGNQRERTGNFKRKRNKWGKDVLYYNLCTLYRQSHNLTQNRGLLSYSGSRPSSFRRRSPQARQHVGLVAMAMPLPAAHEAQATTGLGAISPTVSKLSAIPAPWPCAAGLWGWTDARAWTRWFSFLEPCGGSR